MSRSMLDARWLLCAQFADHDRKESAVVSSEAVIALAVS